MKTLFTLILTAALNVQATVDGITDVAVVTEKYGEGLEYEMRKIPMLSCAGIHEESLNGLWTKPVNITASLGCGGPVTTQNINAGSCMKADLEWDANYMQLQKVVLRIGYCSQIWEQDWLSVQEREDVRNNFVDAAKKAAQFNFGSSTPIEVKF